MTTRSGLRKAHVGDAKDIHALLEAFADKGLLLPRPLWDIYSHIREFTLWDGEREGILGVAALHVTWEDLGELRSLCVLEQYQGQGIGRKLAEYALREARDLGIHRVFALTYKPAYFENIGFRRVDKSELPQKVWVDCIHCMKFPECDEIALILDL
jgi:amino-acid N-acetyltransferase